VTLTSEQRTRIQQTVLAGSNVPRVDNVNFSLSVGTAVPSRVRIVDVPPTLIEIYPQWRGHKYFVVRDEIVIVDRSRKVVAAVPVGSSGGGAASVDHTRGASPSQGDMGALNLAPDEIRQVQLVLKEKGFFKGEPDGVLGPQTTQALIAFQRQEGFEASGRIDSRTVTALGMSNLSGRQGNQGASQPSTTGQGGDQMQSPANQDRGAAQQGNQGGSQPATTGQGGDRMQSPPNQDRGAAQQGNPGGNQPSTTGQGGDRMQQPPAGRDAGGQSGTREIPQDSSPNKESR
jgi:peptidoglycan hydrolase-like protein with peptidoglycan-binding domain